MSKVNDFVNKAVPMIFIDDNDLVSLDPRQGNVDNDPPVKAIRGKPRFSISFFTPLWIYLDGVQAKYNLTNAELAAIWPSLHDCLLLKWRNVKKKMGKTQDQQSEFFLS